MTVICAPNPTSGEDVVLGVDTHHDTHTAAVVSVTGVLLGTQAFPTTDAGYHALVVWARQHGRLYRAGVEGTSSHGIALTRRLHTQAIHVIEVNRPDRSTRRLRGKTDAIDAEAAALADGALSNVAADVLAMLARRIQTLTDEIHTLERRMRAIVNTCAPQLMDHHGVGVDTAAALLIAAGDNPERLGDHAAFAALCGTSPIEASSGKTTRHRLNRGGDRRANSALYTIVITRLGRDPRTRTYAARRTSEGKSTKEIIRCLKRYVARELFPVIRAALAPATTT